MTEGLLKLEHVSKRFGALQALTDVSIAIGTGEVHALVGPEGAGKTTLAGVIGGRLRQDAGKIIFAGKDISKASLPARARLGIATTQRVPDLFPGLTLLEHALLAQSSASGLTRRLFAPPGEASELAAHRALSLLGLDKHGDSRAGELGLRGQKRLEIAMAVATLPRLLVLDEPLAGLEAEDRRSLARVFRTLKVSCSILLIDHELSSVRGIADRVWVMAEGGIIASGSAEAQWSNVEVRAAYFGHGHDHA